MTGAKPGRILFIDDQEDLGGWVQITILDLRADKHQVDFVPTWDEGKELLTTRDYEIIVVDANLNAKQGGVDVAERIREMGFKGHIVLVTGDPRTLDRPLRNFATLLASGMVSLFVKPDPPIPFREHVRIELQKLRSTTS